MSYAVIQKIILAQFFLDTMYIAEYQLHEDAENPLYSS